MHESHYKNPGLSGRIEKEEKDTYGKEYKKTKKHLDIRLRRNAAVPCNLWHQGVES